MMENFLLTIQQQYGLLAIGLSIICNILISIFALPSIFLTTANVAVFGAVHGFLVSWLGELAGAYVSYVLYRYGLQKVNWAILAKYRELFNRKINTQSFVSVFLGITSLRLLPFIPSGIVSILAACAELPLLPYLLGSALGKVPSIAVEAGAGWAILNAETYLMMVVILSGVAWGIGRKSRR